MKSKAIKILTLVMMVFAFVVQSSPIVEADSNITDNKVSKVEKPEVTEQKKSVDKSTVETRTVKEKAAEDNSQGTTPHTGVMGYMYAKTQLKLDISDRKAIQDSPIKTIANRANSVLDTSEWQGNFTDAQVKKLKSQHKFIILRVQYGSNYKDKTFAHNVSLMNKYGMKYGVYSYSRYINPSDAAQEARDLYNRAPNASFYVNDYEEQTVTSGGSDASTAAWLTEMRKHSGKKKVLFYSYYWFMQNNAPNAMKKYDAFWLAAYQSSDPTTASHALWQYTNTYNSSALGQSVDASIATTKSLDWFLSPNTSSPQGPVINTSKDITMKSKGYNLWQDFNFKKVRNTSKDLYGRIYHVKCYYNHQNGNTYYSVYDGNTWMGYINKNAVYELTKKNMNQNVSINAKGINLWNNFGFEQVRNSSNRYYDGNKNLIAKIRYHIAGKYDYYSLYDNNGTWQGYLNVAYATPLNPVNYNKKITIKKNYPLWANFFWKQKGTATVGKTYTAKYLYKTGNGKSYLSLYDSKGNWVGYINEIATGTGSGSNHQVMKSQDIAITSKNYNLWNDLEFSSVRNNSTKLLGKRLKIKCYWEHTNGSIYYSVYDTNNKWLGYLNKDAIKDVTITNLVKKVSINNRNQSLWTGLANNNALNKSAKYYDNNKNLEVRVVYKLSSGVSYYSLYDSNSNWQGYIDSRYTTEFTPKNYNKKITITKNYPLWSNFFWKHSGDAKKGQTYTAKYIYTQGNGKSYYSLYDARGAWHGYINKVATK